MPEGVRSPRPGAEALFGVVVAVLVEWVGVVATVDCVVVAIGSMGAVVPVVVRVVPHDDDQVTTSPITTATRMLIVHLA